MGMLILDLPSNCTAFLLSRELDFLDQTETHRVSLRSGIAPVPSPGSGEIAQSRETAASGDAVFPVQLHQMIVDEFPA